MKNFIKKLNSSQKAVLVGLFFLAMFTMIMFVVKSDAVIIFWPIGFSSLYFLGWLGYMFSGGAMMYKPTNIDLVFHLVGLIFTFVIFILPIIAEYR